MSHEPNPFAEHSRLLAWALYDMRLLLASHIRGFSEAPAEVRAAADLAYALHNLALRAFEGRTFTEQEFTSALKNAEHTSGEPFLSRFRQNTQSGG